MSFPDGLTPSCTRARRILLALRVGVMDENRISIPASSSPATAARAQIIDANVFTRKTVELKPWKIRHVLEELRASAPRR